MQKNKCRVFLGVPIPPSVYHQLKQLLCEHQDKLSDGRWILPENAHITLRFFGDIDRSQLTTLWQTIEDIIKNNSLSSFLMSVGKIAAFPNNKSNLIAAYLNENKKIQELFFLLSDIHADSAIFNNKPFIPHITLYRNKNDKPADLLPITVKASECVVDTLVLYESQLNDDKRIYKQLYSIQLK